MHFHGQDFYPLTQIFHKFSQLRILLQQFHYLLRLLCRHQLTLLGSICKSLTMLGVGIGMSLVTVCLPCLGEQDKRRGIGGLKTERQIEQDKRVDIELGNPCNVQPYPYGNNYRLGNEKHRRPEETGKPFRLECKPIIPEDGAQMNVRKMEPEIIIGFIFLWL